MKANLVLIKNNIETSIDLEQSNQNGSIKIERNDINLNVNQDNKILDVDLNFDSNYLKGEKGDKGEQGEQGIQGIQGPKGDAFKFSDFTLEQLEALRGPQGPAGEQGEKGNPFTFNDFTAEQLELLRGPQGPQGIQGIPGKDGINGQDGYTPIKGVDYFDGQDGINGKDGKDGKDGINGTNGIDGTNGEDGFSPIIATSKSGDTTTISITDKNGTKTATIKDGERGPQGNTGPQGPAGTTDFNSLTNKPTKLSQFENDSNFTSPEIFIAEYGKTSSSDIINAYNSGKICFCKDANHCLPLIEFTESRIGFGGFYANQYAYGMHINSPGKENENWGKGTGIGLFLQQNIIKSNEIKEEADTRVYSALRTANELALKQDLLTDDDKQAIADLHVDPVITESSLEPITKKTFTDVWNTSTNKGSNQSQAYTEWFIGSFKVTSETDAWRFKYKITSWMPNWTKQNIADHNLSGTLTTNGEDQAFGLCSSIIELRGTKNKYLSQIIDCQQFNTSYRAHYYSPIAYPSTICDNAKIYFGYGIYNAFQYYLNNTTNFDKYKEIYNRTFTIEILDAENCELESIYEKEDWINYSTPAGYTLSNVTIVSTGRTQTGDANTYDRLLENNYRIRTGNDSRLHAYSIFGYDKDFNAIPISVRGTAATATSYTIKDGTRVFNTNIGLSFRLGLKYYGSSTALPISTMSSSGTTYTTQRAIDFRYSDNVLASNAAANTLGLDEFKPVYFRGIIKEDGLFYLRPRVVTYNKNDYYCAWIQDLPTESEFDEDEYEYYYWFIGFAAYNASYTIKGYQVNLEYNNPMFKITNGVLTIV